MQKRDGDDVGGGDDMRVVAIILRETKYFIT
jgi:hypothetical protein